MKHASERPPLDRCEHVARLLGFGEGCEVLGISYRTGRTLVARGELPHLRIGKLIKFRRSSLEAWIAAQERKAGER